MNYLELVQAMAAKFPELLSGDPASGGEAVLDLRREFTRRVAATLKAREPGRGWAHKSAGPGRPPSKDAVVDGTMHGYDILGGAGTPNPQPCWNDAGDLTGQLRIEVEAHDYLTGVVPPGDPPPPQTDVSAALRLLLNGMQDQARQLSVIEGRLAALELAVTKLIPPGFTYVPYTVTGSMSFPYLGSARFTGTAEPKK